jgi:hypothetical protein
MRHLLKIPLDIRGIIVKGKYKKEVVPWLNPKGETTIGTNSGYLIYTLSSRKER